MAKWAVSAKVVGSKYLGSYEAETLEKAIAMAEGAAYVSLCHQCARECEDPQIEELHGELDWVEED